MNLFMASFIAVCPGIGLWECLYKDLICALYIIISPAIENTTITGEKDTKKQTIK